MTTNVRPHKTLERDNRIALQLLEGEFSGVIFSYDSIKFEEDKGKDSLKVTFNYELHKELPCLYAKDNSKALFEKELGDFLIELTMFGLEQGTMVYKGGVDEDRKEYLVESDSQ